jgi:hypothetical protein
MWGWCDYVITWSHLERSFGYAQDDKVGWGIVRMKMRLRVFGIGLLLQERDSSVPSRMTSF